MDVILDNNIFFSLMNPSSVNSYLFSLVNVKFLAPEFIKDELKEHEEECLTKSELSKQEFEIRQREVEESIEFVVVSEYNKFLKKALACLSDIDDAPYIALALSKNASIWSNDPHFKKQDLAKVFTTKELIEKLLKYEL